jgi:tellurite resistance protein
VARRLDDPDARRAAFVMAVGVAHIDGRIDSAERLVWDSLARSLDIPGDEAKQLVEAVEHELGEQATVEA